MGVERTLLAVGISVAAGCATGGGEANPFGSGLPPADGTDTGASFTSSISAGFTMSASGTGAANDDFGDEAPGTTVSLDAADDDADGQGEGTTTTGATGGGSTDGLGESSGGGESTGSAAECSQEVSCAGAAGIGTVSGDTGSANLAAVGSEPTWIEFQVTEDNDDVGGEEMRFTVTLTSPACCDFDLFVYRGVEGGSTGCGGFLGSSVSVGGFDTVSMDWGEGLVANGIDDDVWVAVEVVPKNGDCQAGQDWSLTVLGDT